MTVNMHAILVGLLSVSHTREQADHAAREVFDQHAHELAEQIRNADYPVHAVDGAYYAADLIDPEVKHTSTSKEPTS